MTNNGDNNSKHNNHYGNPYIGLEDIGSMASKIFVKEANKFCLTALKDPTESNLYPKILKILETDERIPIVSKMGIDEHGNDVLYNLWKDTTVCSMCGG
jgi:prolyl oligopeptidase PreP (S9A serine peptidase family)